MLNSVLTCPHCSFSKAETMPADACLFFYQCGNCNAMLRAKPGDCCVFCSYGSTKCPSVQATPMPVVKSLDPRSARKRNRHN